MTVRVHFYVLNEANRDDSRSLHVGAGGSLITEHPPAIGDMLMISGYMAGSDDDERATGKVYGNYRVVDRRWSPADYGSIAWPHGEREEGPVGLDVMLAPTPEFFDPPAR